MKRVGILTLYYKNYNFGAQLQAYALQRAIEEMGYECEQIRFVWSNEETIELYENLHSWNQKKFPKFSDRIKHSHNIYNVSDIAECISDYDAFVVGSDQVWGVEDYIPLIKFPVMTLSFVPSEKVKIAYAASMGAAEPSSKIAEILKSEIGGFDAISVREKTAAKYLSDILQRDISAVLDPVFLLKREKWDELAVDAELGESPYIFHYQMGPDPMHKKIVDGISKSLNLPVKKWTFFGERIGPEEFVAWVKNAEYVVTDSFHGTVFSILYHKQFITLPFNNMVSNRSTNLRMSDLLDIFDLSDRCMRYDSEEEQIIKNSVDKLLNAIPYEQVDLLLNDYRKRSFDFLMDALSLDKKTDDCLTSPDKCTGCGVCFFVCPENAISMEADEMGFVYPVRDEKRCISCGRCKGVCNHLPKGNEDDLVIGLQSKDDIVRKNSSSGGVFYEVASHILNNNGIVVACRYDSDFRAVQDFCFSVDELDAFCESKYVQSNAYKTFPKIKEYLEDDRVVLFVGTPCQIVGLTTFLGDVPEHLYLIDLICGGVTAPGLWNKYLNHINGCGKTESISMRYKHTEYLRPDGHPAFSMKIEYGDKTEIHEKSEDLFLRSRLNFYRDSCYACRYKGDNRESDITIGDFVGMKELLRQEYDGYGTTLSIVHTSKGNELLEKCSNSFTTISISNKLKKSVMYRNTMISESMKRKPQHYYMRAIYQNSSIERLYYEDKFWDEFNERQALLRVFYNEVKRNDILIKIERFIRHRLWIDENPNVQGNIYIYGAGKLGRCLIRCTHEISGFIDGNMDIDSCEGIPVYHMGTDKICEKLKKGENITVLVTPIWDYEYIEETLKREFPEINVISVKELVESGSIS